MSYIISDLQPGTIWMQNKTPDNQADLIIKIETAPHCVIWPVYGRYGNGRYTRNFPIMTGDPVTELIPFSLRAKVLYRYVICSSPSHMNKLNSGNAHSILRGYRRIS